MIVDKSYKIPIIQATESKKLKKEVPSGDASIPLRRENKIDMGGRRKEFCGTG